MDESTDEVMDFEGDRSLLVTKMLHDYPSSTKPGWNAWFEGHLIAVHAMYGQAEIGVVPDQQRDALLIHENIENAVLVVCYTRKRNWLQKLFRLRGKVDKVVMEQKPRFNLEGDELDYELPPGFVDTDREIRLNLGLRQKLEAAGELADLRLLPGRHFVGHSEFFTLLNEKDGTVVFAVELTDAQAKVIDDDEFLFRMTVEEAGQITRDARSGMAILRFSMAKDL
jgi:hypothetical protein